MCGIFGITQLAEREIPRARDALHTLAHRGPDQWGDWYENGIYLGHRRLSILDLSERGRQPMVAGGIVLAANGEIYNFAALRRLLEPDAKFSSDSDSEVLLHGYRVWGMDGLLARIEGIFAFVLIDTIRGLIHLARDRIGVKPLYYATDHLGHCAWASELKALVRFYGHDRLEVDTTALYDFLTYRYIPSPKSLYRGIRKLEPGCYATIDLTHLRFSKRRYWSLKVEPGMLTPEQAAERLRCTIEKSIHEQLVSDVPVGCFASGGMDSSVVVAEASKTVAGLRTFAMGFDEESHDETPWALQVAHQFGTVHRSRIMSETEAGELIEQMRRWYDEPFGDTSALPTFALCRLAAEEVTVVLTGDGGDEIFGGYSWYQRFPAILRQRRSWMSRAAPSVERAGRNRRGLLFRSTRRLHRYVSDELDVYGRFFGGLTRGEKTHYAESWSIPKDYDDYWFFRQHYNTELSPTTRLQYLDFNTYLPEDILTKIDRVSMAVSLEARVPLLNTELVEFTFSIPAQILYESGDLKGLLKSAYRDTLPDAVRNRPKKGFSVPTTAWAHTFPRLSTPQELILQRLFPDALHDVQQRTTP